jgi:hypothetical protein
MGGRAPRGALAALAAALGSSIVFCASAWAKTAQTITLTQPSEAAVGKSVTEPAESSAGLGITFTSETSLVCVLSYYGAGAMGGKPYWTISLIAGGTCTVIAVQGGNGEYEATEARLSFKVSGPPPGGTQKEKPPTTGTIPGLNHAMPGHEKPTRPKTKAPAEPIPAKVRARLLREARSAASKDGDNHPSDIRAVRTTRAQFAHLVGSASPKGSKAHERVYGVAMKGHFKANCKKGSPCTGRSTGPVLELEAGLSGAFTSQIASRYPNLNALGTAVRLGPVKAHMAPSSHA